MIRKQLQVKTPKDAMRILKEMNEDYRYDTFDSLDFLTFDGHYIGTAIFDGDFQCLRFVRLAGELAERENAGKRNTKMHRVCSKRRKSYDRRERYTPLFEC